MLRQSPSRNGRTRAFKVKHAGQICLLLTFFLWLLYQVRHSYYKTTGIHEEISPGLLPDGIETSAEFIKFGRKDLINPLAMKGKQKRDEDEEEDGDEESVVEGRGAGDDEIDANDQERAEEEDGSDESELEDLIDEEDRDKNDGQESGRRLVGDGIRGSGPGNGEDVSDNKENNLFFRDGLIEQTENLRSTLL